jgi:uncharacterized membrane protein YhfC
MYPLLLAVHSLLRWAVLAAGGAAILRALMGRKHTWTPADDRAGLWFVLAMDVQFLLGLVLYAGVSPITRAAFADFGGAMGNSMLRFWAVEHLFGMLIAVALVHIGRVRIRKATDTARRHRLALIFYGLALAAILASIPWPWMQAGRPLFRGL